MSHTISNARNVIEPYLDAAIAKVIEEPSLYLGIKRKLPRAIYKKNLKN